MVSGYANISSKNILRMIDLDVYDFILGMHHSYVKLTELKFKIERIDGVDKTFDLEKIEDEVFTTKYKCSYSNGKFFIITKPKPWVFANTKIREQFGSKSAEDGFTISGPCNQSWAVIFYITPDKPVKKEEIDEGYHTEFIKKHIEAFQMAESALYLGEDLRLGLVTKLLDFIITNPSSLFRVSEIDAVLEFMEQNFKFFNSEHQKIIQKLLE